MANIDDGELYMRPVVQILTITEYPGYANSDALNKAYVSAVLAHEIAHSLYLREVYNDDYGDNANHEGAEGIQCIMEKFDIETVESFLQDVNEDEKDNTAQVAAPSIRFDTIEEMLNEIRTGTFTNEEVEQLVNFDRDEQGRVILFDLDNVLEPVYPSDYDNISVVWYGSSYCFRGTNSTITVSPDVFHLISEEFYTEETERFGNWDQYKDCDRIATENRDGIEVTVYDYSVEHWSIYEPSLEPYLKPYRICTYALSDADTELFICEHYDPASNLQTPTSIDIYGKSDDKYFKVYVTAFTDRPSPEWLLDFDINPYST